MVQCNKLLSLQNYPNTFIFLALCILLCIPSYFSVDYAQFWAVASNLAYLVPLVISLSVNQYMIAVAIFITFLVSSFYHTCATYNACIYNKHDSTYIDVMFSWFLLYTLASYAAFREYFIVTLPVHFLVIILTHEAHCNHAELGFDCEVVRIAIVSLYFLVLFITSIRSKFKKIDITDAIVGLVLFGLSFFFYLKSHGEDLRTVYGNHALWHTLSAAAGALVLTIYKDSPIHSFGIREDGSAQEQRKLLDRKDVY